MATIQTVEEQSTATDAVDGTEGPDSRAESLVPVGERDGGAGSRQPPARTADDRTPRRRPFLGQTAAITIIAALIASMTLAAVTAFNTLRSDIISIRTEMRDEFASVRDEIRSVDTGLRAEMRAEIGSLRTELRDEIGSVETGLRAEIGSLRTELHDFRTEVGTVLLDHAERLARIEAMLLNGTTDSSHQS